MRLSSILRQHRPPARPRSAVLAALRGRLGPEACRSAPATAPEGEAMDITLPTDAAAGDAEAPLRLQWDPRGDMLALEASVAPVPSAAAERLTGLFLRLNATPSESGGLRFVLDPDGTLCLLCLMPGESTSPEACLEAAARMAAERRRWGVVLERAGGGTLDIITARRH